MAAIVKELQGMRNDLVHRQENQIQGLENQLLSASTQLKDVQTKVTSLQKSNEELEFALNQEREISGSLKSELKKLQEKHYVLQDDLENAKNSIQDLEVRLEFSSQRIKKLEEELAEKRAQDEKNATIAQLNEKKTELEGNIMACEGIMGGGVISVTSIGSTFGPLGTAIGFGVSALAWLLIPRNKRLEWIDGLTNYKSKLMSASGVNDPESLKTLFTAKKIISSIPKLS